jgi:streptomycin 6-kinase
VLAAPGRRRRGGAGLRGHRDDEQLAAEGDALEFWRPTGAAVDLLDRDDAGFTLLLERLEPGHTLDDAGASMEERLTELGRLAARLHAAGPPPGRSPRLQDFAPDWSGHVAGASEPEVLVYLDLHGGNALRAGETWKVIDPKGVRADRDADVWALMDPGALRHLPEDRGEAARAAERWVSRYAEAAALDLDMTRAWTRTRARLEALECEGQPPGTPGERAWVAALHRLADALE